MRDPELESVYEKILATWTPELAVIRRKKELTRTASGYDSSKPCEHGVRCVTDCKQCYNWARRGWISQSPEMQKAYKKRYRANKKNLTGERLT